MTERKLETDVFPFASKGFDSAQAKLLRNLFDRYRVYTLTTAISGPEASVTQVAIPELSFVAKGGKSYKFTMRGSGAFLGNGDDVEFSFDYDASTDMTAVSRGILYADESVTPGVIALTVLDYDADVTVTFENDPSGQVYFEWTGILSVPSTQKVVPHVAMPQEQGFSYIELELFELS